MAQDCQCSCGDCRQRPKTKARSASPTIGEVIQAVASFYRMFPGVLRGSRGYRRSSTARAVAMLLIRDEVRASFSEIGMAFDERHHTAVLLAVRKIRARIPADRRLESEIETIRSSIRRADAVYNEPRVGVYSDRTALPVTSRPEEIS